MIIMNAKFGDLDNLKCSFFSYGKQMLVLDEADQILDHGFKSQVDAIISQIPKVRQTLLFSATQTKSVKDLARVSLRDPEYISVHEEARTATPDTLEQYAMIVPLEQKLNMLWSFIKRHLNSKTIVFLSSVKQVIIYYASEKYTVMHSHIDLHMNVVNFFQCWTSSG
jgi:ATP-dependent RNA helicase DDX10/DBP4